ncbi:uncharacterized protein LOC142358148 [Convolutriloba macropyga]|uniref:uncharacterized protein LOC142358148 n=1 Tax=Convolutriloba macropyga TaxID=536237 RepID=UPI003F5248AC
MTSIGVDGILVFVLVIFFFSSQLQPFFQRSSVSHASRLRTKRALKFTEAVSEVNKMPVDLDHGGPTFPLRRSKMDNLTDVLTIQWTCISVFGKDGYLGKEISYYLPSYY